MPGRTRLVAIVTLGTLLLIAPPGPDAEAQDDVWVALKKDFDAAFEPLPIDRMFFDLDAELRRSRRDPFSDSAEKRLLVEREKVRLLRAQIRAERRKREDVVSRLGAYGGPLASSYLIHAHERLLEEIDTAQANLDRHIEALRIDINPGVDPGGVYWERWVKGKEMPSARGILADEKKLRDLVLAQCARLMTPEIRTWLGRAARSGKRAGVRERAIDILAGSPDPVDVATLGVLLGEEKAVWARIAILEALGRAKAEGAAPFVLGALADAAWPVRAAAVAVILSRRLRDATAIDRLVDALGAAEGRLRHDIRNALVAATGQSFGLLVEEWKLWWSANREGFEPRAKPAVVTPIEEDLPEFFGIPTASRRIVFLVSRGREMSEPTLRRPLGNDGKPSPPPAVDTAGRIAAWELGEAIGALPRDAKFTVILYGPEPHVWSKRLKAATKDTQKSAARFAAKFAPDGYASLSKALEIALGIGVSGRGTDLALRGLGDVDTIFVVAGGSARVGSLGGPASGREAVARVGRYRRVVINTIGVGRGSDLGGLARATGGTSRGIEPK